MVGFKTIILFLFCISVAFATEDAFNLGPLGAEGVPITPEETKAHPALKGLAGLRITAIHPEGAAEQAGLQVGDLIVGVGKMTLPKKKYPVYALMEILEHVLTTEAARADIIVLREGKRVVVKMQLESLGKHGKNCPIVCPRCDRLASQSLQFLAQSQKEDGSFETKLGGTNGSVVVTSICGLAFLASGSTPSSGPYAENIVKCKDFVMANCGKEEMGPTTAGANWSQVNWALGYGTCFLAEYYAHDPQEDVRAKLEEFANTLVRNQEPSGGWAHGPGGPNALGYTDFAKVSQWCLAALGACRKSGIPVPDITIKRALNYFVDCTEGDGGIGYSPRPGQKGIGDPGRTGGAIFAYALCDQKGGKFFKNMTSYFMANMQNIPDGHASPVMHFMSSALACSHLDHSYWKKLFETFRYEFIAARRPDGSFSARPTKESRILRSNTDRAMGHAWTTGSYLVTLLLQKGHLKLLSGQRKK